MDNESPSIDWQARAIAAEAKAFEYRDHGESVKRELLSALQRQDERFRALSIQLTVAEYRIAELETVRGQLVEFRRRIENHIAVNKEANPDARMGDYEFCLGTLSDVESAAKHTAHSIAVAFGVEV